MASKSKPEPGTTASWSAEMRVRSLKAEADERERQRQAELARKAAWPPLPEATDENLKLYYRRVAFVDVARLLDPSGRPLPIDEIDNDTRTAIAGLEVRVERQRGADTVTEIVADIKKFTQASRLHALDALREMNAKEGDRGQADRLAELVAAIQEPVTGAEEEK